MGDFTTQVDALDEAADKFLSPMATELADLAAKITGTGRYDEKMFDPGGDGARPLSPVRSPFAQTRDFFGRALSDDAENLQLAAQALKEIAKRYREADGQG